MEILSLKSKDTQHAAERAAEVLRAGGVVLYPTDTLYGLGADAFSDEAVAKVYAIKGRETDKPIHCIVADIEMAEQYAEMSRAAEHLAAAFLPGALTLILSAKGGPAFGGKKLGSGILHGMDAIGIRIPKNDFCIALAKKFGKPYTTTSANVSGEVPQGSVEEILAQLGA